MKYWLAVILLVTLGLAILFAQAISSQAGERAITYPSLEPTAAWDKEQAQLQETAASWQTWQALPQAARSKVDARILAELQGTLAPAHLRSASVTGQPLTKTRFLVYLQAEADLQAIAQKRFATMTEQRTAVFSALVDVAQATQPPLARLLDSQMALGSVAAYQPFYIFNGFAVEGDLDTLVKLARRDDVARIVANHPVLPVWSGLGAASSSTGGLDDLHPDNWNIDLVDAERVWNELGITGLGAVVASIDSGVSYTHTALWKQYRGNLGGGVLDHNYNWFEPDDKLYPNGNLGASASGAPYPCKGSFHGTHTMGTMVGQGQESGTQVGMAPGARWIATPLGLCPTADEISIMKSFQWILCPTDLSGDLATADCSKAPNVVNNSWGLANPAADTFRPAIQALRAAGIAPVFAAGNPLAGPGSIASPANAPEAIAVGATDSADKVAFFSGRGPSFYPGEQKPELSAPGVMVTSTVLDNGYTAASGTSMAAPHVAGLVALMVSADLQDGVRNLDVDELERFMMYTAVDLGTPGPDDDYGYGRINAYDAVRWALSAGDLRGTVRDALSSVPVEGAVLSATRTAFGPVFTAQTNANGYYSTTVPAGDYAVSVEAWGYYSHTLSGRQVVTGALTLTDFSLTPLPTATLSGAVLSGSLPVSGALVYVAGKPSINLTTGADGAYQLTLPAGLHEVLVKASGYRILRERLNVIGSGLSHDFSMTPAPTILLVEADAEGWQVHNFFGWALEQENYLYDLWQVQYTTFNDTQVLADGSVGYGIPSPARLGAYDLVIWAHGDGSPQGMGAGDELVSYLDSGGRLIISGQNIGRQDNGTVFYDDYLHADYVEDAAAVEGEFVSGLNFIAGLRLEITNASLYGYANGPIKLAPDAVAPRDINAFPLMNYDNGAGIAALGVSTCASAGSEDYRAVYFALGYENIGPRAYTRDPAAAQVLARSITWVTGSRLAYDAIVAATPSRQMDAMGNTVTYSLQLSNRGFEPGVFELSLAGNTWPTRILSGTASVTLTHELLPCGSQTLRIEVDIPFSANYGDQDMVAVSVSPYPGGAPGLPRGRVDLVTTAFPKWQVEARMPTVRGSLGVAALPGDIYYYAIGGMGFTNLRDNISGHQTSVPIAANERYNACTDEWETMAAMPTARAYMGVAAVGDRIYAVGGSVLKSTLDVVEIYNPLANSWSSASPLPEARTRMAIAAHGAKLYVFGGDDAEHHVSDKTYMYDPATDRWYSKAPMPDGGRSCSAAAEMDGKIYVIGGRAEGVSGVLDTMIVYDPTADAWSAVILSDKRLFSSLVAAPDGYMYVIGGSEENWKPAASTRYNLTTNVWQVLSPFQGDGYIPSASAYAAGRVFAVGGSTRSSGSDMNESFRLTDDFCFSNESAWQRSVRPGDRITYTMELYPDLVTLTHASLVAPIPAGTSWAGFGLNGIGASYNSHAGQVEWRGTIPAGMPVSNARPLSFTFGLDVASGNWHSGDLVSSVVTFDSGTGRVFTRTALAALDFPDPFPSAKTVSEMADLGQALTYTLHIWNASARSDVFTLYDAIPSGTTYLPGSLAWDLGTAGYDPANDAITWSHTLPQLSYANPGDDYVWGDSDGNGAVPGVSFDWIDISSTGTRTKGEDDEYTCGLPIGFELSFYGQDETTFCASTNGFVSFDLSGYSSWHNDSTLPSFEGNAALIAAVWEDLEVLGPQTGIYYQTFGTAPNRYLVVQWRDVLHPAGLIDFEIILYESGAIKVQILDAPSGTDVRVTTGLEDYTETRGLCYACDVPGSIHDGLAILFVPPGGFVGRASADIRFAVTTTTPLPTNTWIVNTAVISGLYGTVERSVHTLINPTARVYLPMILRGSASPPLARRGD
jgi:uncharacterized repeat protein (TIGR01451 family)